MRFALCTLLMLVALGAAAEDYIVNPDGSGDYPTVQAAIDAIPASGSGTLLLGDGVFSGEGNQLLFLWHKNVNLSSLSGDPAACSFNTSGNGIVSGSSEGGQLSVHNVGFVECGSFYNIWINDYLFYDCSFSGCVRVMQIWTDGFGIADATFHDCVITGCTEAAVNLGTYYDCEFRGNAMVSTGYGDFQRCVFVDNSAPVLFDYDGGDTYWMGAHFTDCDFVANNAGESLINNDGGGVLISDSRFFDNTGPLITSGYSSGGIETPYLHVEGCSFVFNHGTNGYDFGDDYGLIEDVSVDRCIFAFRDEGEVFSLDPTDVIPTLTDCLIFGNNGGDWVGEIADQAGIGCNMLANPVLCNWGSGDLSLYDISPCLPGNNDCGVLIGAEGQGCSDPTSVPGEGAPGIQLAANHPNPFNPATRISFQIARAGFVTLSIHDAEGRCVSRPLDHQWRAAGSHALDWQATTNAGSPLPSGVYFACLKAGARRDVIKMTLLR